MRIGIMNEIEIRNKSPRIRRLFLSILFAPLAGFIILLLIFFLVNEVPTYLIFPIPFPDDDETSYIEDWTSTTYSIYQSQWDKTRDYIWRKDGLLTIDNSRNNESWQTIIDNIDHQLAKLGWSRNEAYHAPCWVYLPESRFLAENRKNGYVYYRHINYDATLEYTDDFICLAVWKIEQIEDDQHESYAIVLLTVRPSLFEKVLARLVAD